jgi:hypothetical protein
MSFLKPLEIQPKPVNIPFEDFYAVALAIAKHEYRRAERVKLEAVFHNAHQPVYGFSHIRRAAT